MLSGTKDKGLTISQKDGVYRLSRKSCQISVLGNTHVDQSKYNHNP